MSLRDMVITSQLLPPTRRRGVLRRRRVEKRLARILEMPLTLLQAGTGYGKSTELAALTDMADDVFWYTISEPERDPLLFLAHLLAAFDQGARPGASTSSQGGWGQPFLQHLEESGARAGPGALNFLLNTLTTRLTREAVLVLDDYHLVADVPEVAAMVERLIDYRPPRLHVVLAGRVIPASPALTRWRVKGQVLTLDRTDLAFTADEIVDLFQLQAGLTLSPTQAAALAGETEGWVIALQMIAQQLHPEQPNPGAATSALRAPAGEQTGGGAVLEEVLAGLPSAMEALFDYLALEVLARQTPEVQQFMLSSAVLRQMSGPACAAVTGQVHSTVLLHHLHEAGMFITPSTAGGTQPSPRGDGAIEVYRFQRLFHDFLLARLSQDPERARALHRKAAAYFQSGAAVLKKVFTTCWKPATRMKPPRRWKCWARPCCRWAGSTPSPVGLANCPPPGGASTSP